MANAIHANVKIALTAVNAAEHKYPDVQPDGPSLHTPRHSPLSRFAKRTTRDKIAASKKKGMWMGGVPPLG